MDLQITGKANRVLNIFLVALLLILIRVWYLAVIQRDEQVQQAHRPQRRTAMEKVERATIRDRFNLPLAINKIQYNAAVVYADIRQIPTTQWEKDSQGNSVRVPARKNYIHQLARLLGQELNLDPETLDDLIHAKASLFPHTPFVLKADLTESEYYRLRMLERDWLGLHTERAFKRIYPQGKTAGDIIGYMGAINQTEHLQIAQELEQLHDYLAKREKGELAILPPGFDNPIAVQDRLKALQEKAYTINDCVGKIGIEGKYEQNLRGYYGKKNYEVDVKGNILRELPGSRKASGGERIVLTLSSELQNYAESLLAHAEGAKGNRHLNDPWIKGGAIVAMIPETGEVVACASYPRFDPNDFIPTFNLQEKQSKRAHLLRWLENQDYIGEIWDGKRPLEREVFSFLKGEFYEETLDLSWDIYLETIFPDAHPARKALQQIGTIRNAAILQKQQNEEMLSAIPLIADRLLVLDLCRMLCPLERFPDHLLEAVGKQSLSSFRALTQVMLPLKEAIRAEMRMLFHETDFKNWRAAQFKDFLKQKRLLEKKAHKYPRPYTDYLEAEEKTQFEQFWNLYGWNLVYAYFCDTHSSGIPQPYWSKLLELKTLSLNSHPHFSVLKEILSTLPVETGMAYLQSMRAYADLKIPLLGTYLHLKHFQTQQDLAGAFYPKGGYHYGRSQAFRQSTPQGSVFKLITSYQTLIERYPTVSSSDDLSPLTMIDEIHPNPKGGQILGFYLSGEPIPRVYKGGRLPRSSHPRMGRMDLLGAIEQSSNVYFSLVAGDYLSHPMALADAARLFGFGEKSGIELPGEIEGTVPDDLVENRTGLYSFAIGQHSLVVTPLQTATAFSAIATQGKLFRPKMVQFVAGKQPYYEKDEVFSKEEYPHQDALRALGIPFPLFTETERNLEKPYVTITPSEIRRTLPFPKKIHRYLLTGMQRVIKGAQGRGRPSVIRPFPGNSKALPDYLALQDQIVAKTGTAEIGYKHTLDAMTKPILRNHVWFTAISYPDLPKATLSDNPWAHPELVVVVYLRYGRAGKDGATLAAQMIHKWRQIQASHPVIQ